MTEVLVAVVLLGVVGVGVLAAMAAAARGARVHDDVADTQTWLSNAGDRLMTSAHDEGVYEDTNTEVPGYVSCEAATAAEIRAGYQAQVEALDAGVPDAPEVRVDSVRFWNGSAFDDTCHVVAGHRLQQVRLSATGAGGTERTLTVFRRPFAATSDGSPAGDASVIDPGEIQMTENRWIHGTTTTTSTTSTTSTTVPAATTTSVPAGPATTTTSTTSTTTSTTSTTSTSTTSTTTTTSTTSTTLPTSTLPPGGLVCSAVVSSSWNGGYVMGVTITNRNGYAVDGWSATVTLPRPSKPVSSWNAELRRSGADITATPMAYNSSIAADGSTTFGWQGDDSSDLPVAGNPVPCEVTS